MNSYEDIVSASQDGMFICYIDKYDVNMYDNVFR